MTALLRDKPFFKQLEEEHRKWLSGFDSEYTRNWEMILNQDEEAAFAEAGIRRLLQNYHISVKPNEDLKCNEQRPDFHCIAGDYHFCVEITNISIDAATSSTAISNDESNDGVQSFKPLNRKVFGKALNKAKKCASSSTPVLVAVTTFHGSAAMASFNKTFVNWLLTGETYMKCPINMRTGRLSEDICATKFEGALFLKPNTDGWFDRRTISGLILCHPTMNMLPVLGVLHPYPHWPFEPSILPQIEFGNVVVDPELRTLTVKWPSEDNQRGAVLHHTTQPSP